jgi:hypothetical protein
VFGKLEITTHEQRGNQSGTDRPEAEGKDK